MYDDFLVVSNYRKLSAKFLSGTLTLLRRWEFCRIFYFLLEQLLEFVLRLESGTPILKSSKRDEKEGISLGQER